jgi:hypothetical protein
VSAINRPTKPCSNPACGNTLYTATYAFDADVNNPRPVWECTCCLQQTPRQSRNRRSNNLRALDLIADIQAEWEDTEKALQVLVDSGTPSGCLLVHGRAFNYHLDSLRGIHMKPGQKKLSNWDIRYHAAQAREDLKRAKQFVQEKQSAKLQS